MNPEIYAVRNFMWNAQRALKKGLKEEGLREVALALNEAAKAIYDANEKIKRIVSPDVGIMQNNIGKTQT